MNLPTRILLIFSAIAGFSVVLCVGLFWMLSNGDKSAREASAQFATAVVNQNASLAPKGASQYIDGVRAHFGPVSSARVIDTRNTSHGHGSSSYTYYVGDVLLSTAKGPAVVELEFDGSSLSYSNKTVSHVTELQPMQVPDGKLTDAEFTALAKAFHARGNQPASSIEMSQSLPDPPALVDVDPVDPVPTEDPVTTRKKAREQRGQDRQMQKGLDQLECVKKAHGDIEKLTRCASI